MLVHDLSLQEPPSRSCTPFVRSCMEPLVGVLFSLGLADSFAAAAAAPPGALAFLEAAFFFLASLTCRSDSVAGC